MATNVIEIRRSEGATAGYSNLIDLCGRAWWCYQIYKADKRVKSVRLANFQDVVEPKTNELTKD